MELVAHLWLAEGWSETLSWRSTERVVRRYFARWSPLRLLGTLSEIKTPGQQSPNWIILRNIDAQLAQLTTN